MKRALVAIALAACTHHAAPAGPGSGSGSAAPTPGDALPEITPGIQPAAWLVGDWKATEGAATAHWVAAAGALYGVVLDGDRAEVAIIDDTGADHALQLWSYDDHGAGGPVDAAPADAKGLAFKSRNDAPGPVTRTFTQTGDDAMISGGLWMMGQDLPTVEWARGMSRTAPELEDADRAFAQATATRGPDGWADAYAPDGVNWGGGQVVQGHDAIKADIAQLLGGASLTWTPVTSRMGASGEIGFTVGTFAVVVQKKVAARGSYVTVWRKQPDGSWKVQSDAGRPFN